MVDGVEIGTRHVSDGPYSYPLDSTQLSNGSHTLQIWAHTIANTVALSPAVTVAVDNSMAAVPAPAPSTPPNMPPSTPSDPGPVRNAAYPITLTYPMTGQAVSGSLDVTASISQTLDPSGSYLMVDGQEIGTHRATSAPFLYQLDTTALSQGPHQLQIWAHDIGNNNLLSNPVTVMIHN